MPGAAWSHPSAGFLIVRRLTQVVLAGLLCAVAGTEAWSEPPGNVRSRLESPAELLRPPSECEMRPSRAVEVTQVAPNALSKARAMAAALDMGLLPSEAGYRPPAADNSTLMYFPPVRAQTLGDCTCYSSGYYWNTYTQARDEGFNAASGNPDVICSARFIFSLICEGHYGAECTEHVITRLSDVGCSNITLHALDKDYTEWPSEAAWVQALENRTGTPHSIRADTAPGLEAIKQHIANGNCLVTRGVTANNLQEYPDNSVVGIDNRVWYSREDGLRSRHSLCVVGYDDNRSYVDHRDGLTYHGAFLIANSRGPDWGWYNSTETGSKGFFWISYEMFLDGEFGWYDDPWPYKDPCYDNAPYPEMYYNDDRPQYRPSLYAVAGINHNERNKLIFTGGIGPTGAADFTGPLAIEQTDQGEIAIDDTDRVAVDLSDGAYLFVPGVSKQLFVKLVVDDSATSSATITSADFYHDLDGDGTYETLSSTDPTVTVLPDTTGYATVQLLIPREVYVDDSNTTGPWDGSRDHPYQTIQEGVDNSDVGSTIWVLPGTYTEGVTMAAGRSLIGAGASVTTIDSQNADEAVYADGITDATVAGFTLTTGGTSYTALRTVNSTVTVRDCVATGNRSGFGAGQIGTLTVDNCLVLDNSHHGVWEDGGTDVAVRNTTIVGNGDNGVVRWGAGMVTLTDTIVRGNTDDIDGDAAGFTVSHCCIGDGDFAGSNGNIALDPLFVTGLHGAHYLSQTAAGQGSDSPCVDTGSDTAANLGLDELTTRTDGVSDAGTVNMGYHTAWPLLFTDVYWDEATASVVLVFASEAGVDYTVESAEAGAYSDGVSWSDLITPVTAAGSLTTVSDDLSTNPLANDFRFYRVKRADDTETGRQTAAVFELDLNVGFAVRQFFVSTPLIPDPDYAGVQDVISTQLDYTGVKMDKLTADSGLCTRATYTPGAGWANTFSIAAGEAYMLDVGNAVPTPHALRLTGTVPEQPLTVSVTRASFAVTRRWMAYSMPQATTLGALGLETAITPIWDPTNEVRLLPLGTTIWQRYFWDGADWREGSLGGSVAGATPIVCGQGILFIHNGLPGQPNTLTWPTWYLRPPNVW